MYHIGIEHDYEQSDQAGYSIRDMDYVDEASGMRTILQLHAYCQSIQFFIVVLLTMSYILKILEIVLSMIMYLNDLWKYIYSQSHMFHVWPRLYSNQKL